MVKDEPQAQYEQGMVLGKILTKLESIEKGMRKVDDLEKRMTAVEKETALIKGDLDSIKASLAKPKTPWWSVASGLAGFGSVLALLLLLLPKLLEIS